MSHEVRLCGGYRPRRHSGGHDIPSAAVGGRGLSLEVKYSVNFEGLLPALSVRGRFAYGLGCVERACTHFGMKSAVMDELLDMLWSILNRDDFVAWEREIMDFFARLRKLPEGADAALGWACLPPDQLKAFDLAVDRAIGIIADAHMFTNEDEQDDDIPLLMAVVAFLEANRIPLPDIGPVLRFSKSENYWLGAKFPPNEVRDSLRG